MKKYFATLTVLLFIVQTHAQTWINVQATGATRDDSGNGICTDAGNNTFVAGSFGDSIQFGATKLYTGAGGGIQRDIFIVKYNSSMGVAWAKRYGGTNNDDVFAIKTDVSGNIYIAGTYYTSITFDTVTITQSGGPAIYIVKLNSSGTALWAKSATTVGSDFYVGGLGLDANNNIYISGSYAGNADFGNGVTLSSILHPLTLQGSEDVFTAKYNNSGICLWARSGGSYQGDRSYGIAVTSGGTSYITGYYGQNANFSGSMLTYNGGGVDGFVAAYNTSGTLVLLTPFYSPDYEAGYGICLDASTNIYITGLSSGFTLFDTTTVTPHGSYDMFIAKYNSGGDIQWVRNTFSSQWEHGRKVAVDGGGNVYVGGEFYHGGTTSFPGIFFTSKGYYDPFVVKYNHEGEFEWAQRGGSFQYDYINGIALTDSGKIVITGSYGDNVEFANFSFPRYGGVNGRDYYVGKLRSDINTGTVTGLPACAGSSVTVPYTANIPFNAGNIFTAQLSDAQGRFANAVNIGTLGSTASGNISANIPANTPTGTGYRIRVVSSDSVRTGGDNGTDLSIWGLPVASITSADTNFCSGDSLFISATAGTGYSYQWKKNNVNISGATASVYYAKTSGDYSVVITESVHGCTNTSNTIHATLRNKPNATITPGAPTTFCDGLSVLLYANSGNNLTYQWKKNGNNIAGETSSVYTANTSGNYTVIVTNIYGCSKTSAATAVTVNPLPTVSFSGLAANYNLNASPATLTGSPAGGTFSGPGISGNTFTPSSAGVGGPYTITYTYFDGNGCSNSQSQQTSVTCALPAKPGTITAAGGNTKVCPGDSKTYSINAVSGATSYTWTPPPGGVVANGQGTTSVIINYTAGFTASDSLRVVANNTCGSGPAKALSIKRNTPATPGTITGQNFGVCNQNNVAYSVNFVAGITYNWTFNTANAVVASGQGTNAITVNYGAGYVSDSLKVTANNACGSSAEKKLNVKATPATPVSIAGNTSVCANQQNVPYSISPVAAATNYTWVGPAGSHISDGVITSPGATLVTTATSVTVDYAASGGTLKVRANNGCGSGSYRSVTIAIVCREGIIADNNSEVNVSPNPSSGDFNFEVNGAFDENISIQVFDVIGQLILSETNLPSHFTIRNPQLIPGVYSAVITAGEIKKAVRIVKVE